MKFIVFYLEFINSLEYLRMFFSSAALNRGLRRYAATPRPYLVPLNKSVKEGNASYLNRIDKTRIGSVQVR